MGVRDSTDANDIDGCIPRRLLFARRRRLLGLSASNHSSRVGPAVRGGGYQYQDRSSSSADTAVAGHESKAPIIADAAAASASAVAAAVATDSPAGVNTVDSEAAKTNDDRRVPERASFLKRFLVMYCDALHKRPVFTKAISSGLIGLLGDLLAQTVGWGIRDGPVPWNGTRALWRSSAVMLDGFFINGPLLHYVYEFLENRVPAGDSIRASIVQVAVDVFIIDPVFAFIFVWSTGLIEGRSVKHDILDTLEHSYPEMVLWLVVIGLAWAPMQVYLFNRYPVQFRVLMADMIDLVWTCVSSFFTHDH